jgi:hypothetical protein
MMPPPGATPPGPGGASMPAPQGGGTGAATSPGPMPGAGQQAMTGVKMALEALQKSLTGLPMGSEIHTAVLKAITDISKNMAKGDGQGDQSAMIQQLAQMARQQQTGGANPAAGMMPGGGGGAPPQPQPPAMH